MRKKTFLATLAAAMVLTGCGSSISEASYSTKSAASTASLASFSTMAVGADKYSGDTYDISYDSAESAMNAVSSDASDSGSTIRDVDTSTKIVRNMSFSVETTDMTALIDSLQTKVSELDGYIENSQISGGDTRYDDGYYLDSDGKTQYDSSYTPSYIGRLGYKYATYAIRIPAEKLDEFANEIESTSNVTSQSATTEDITLSYVDTDSRKKSLEDELETLEAMARKAETVDEMIQIQAQISDVRYNLENIQSQLKVMDQRVAYSTVDLDITEVTVLTNTNSSTLSWADRIADGFKTSCETVSYTLQEGFITFVSNLPMILFRLVEIATAGLAVFGIVKSVKAIRAKKTHRNPDDNPKIGSKHIATRNRLCEGSDCLANDDGALNDTDKQKDHDREEQRAKDTTQDNENKKTN